VNRLLFVSATFVAAFGALAEELPWPQFRGPEGNGVAAADANPPVAWSETENIAWKTAIPHAGHSSPVVAEGKVWLTTATEEGTEYFAVAVDAESGEILCNKKVFTCADPEPLGNNVNGYASPTAVAEPGRVYVHFGRYGTACLDSDSYEVLWTREDLECRHYRGPGSSPVIHEDLLILTFDGVDQQYVIALDKTTGETVWKTERTTVFDDLDEDGQPYMEGDQRKAFSTPTVVDVEGRPILVSPGSSAAYGYDARTGEAVWNLTLTGHTTSTSPIFGNGHAYFATGYGGTEFLALRVDGEGDVTASHVTWRLTGGEVPNTPSPLLVGGLLYIVSNNGIASCVDAETGEIFWSERIGGNYMSSPTYAAGRVYMTSSQGNTTVLRAGREFELLAKNRLDEGALACPAVVGDAMFHRTATHLYRVESE
jgi:outer membrane protein assembly factor BamB